MVLFIRIFINIILFTRCTILVDAQKLNIPKLLLPYNSVIGINFTLEATEGCLSWKSTRPDVVSVHPVHESEADDENDGKGCSRFAVVTSVSKVPDRKTAIVIAQDIVSGNELRCDVIVDKIVSIEIQTTTKELYLDDSPEEFVLKAFNDKADVFSSLEGMEFEWNLVADEGSNQMDHNPPNKVLRILKYVETSYVAPPYIRSLEKEGKRGDRILLMGFHTGSAIVTVKAVDEVYKHIEIDTIRTLVVANLQLTPSLVYIMPHTSVVFSVDQLKQGRASEVKMPSPIYYLHVDDDRIVSLDMSISMVTGLLVGHTDIRLKGQNAQLAGVFREPSAAVYVVEPAYIEFSIHHTFNWLLETGVEYILMVHIMDAHGHSLLLNDKVRIELTTPQEHITLLDSSVNGSYHLIRAKQKGVCIIYAKLLSVHTKNGAEMKYDSIDGSHDLEIVDPVVVHSKEINVPLSQSPARVHIHAKGGKGRYIWRPDDVEMVVVVDAADSSSDGHGGSVVVDVVSSSVRKSHLHVIDVVHATFRDSSVISVLPPVRIELDRDQVEIKINETLVLPIGLILTDGSYESAADACEHLNYDIQVSNDNLLDNIHVLPIESSPSSFSSSYPSSSCAILSATARHLGTTELFVSYSYDDVIIKNSVVLAVYEPLKMLSPDKYLSLTPGSSIQVVVSGGPMPWLLDDTKYFRTVNVFEDDNDGDYAQTSMSFSDLQTAISSSVHASEQIHTFTAFCHEESEKSVKLSIGNQATPTNRHPAVSHLIIPVFCSEPKMLKIVSFPYVEESFVECDLKVFGDGVIPVPADQKIYLKVNFLDKYSKRIENATSVAIRWDSSGASLASFVFGSENEHSNPSQDEVALQLGGLHGDLVVMVTVESYNHHYGYKKIDPILSDRITFHILRYPSLSSSSLILLNSHLITGKVLITDGSGQFKLTNSLATVVMVMNGDDDNDEEGIKRDSGQERREILIAPLSEGRSEITIMDGCLLPVRHTTLNVMVADVGVIIIKLDNYLPLNTNNGNKLKVEILDKFNNSIPTEYYQYMGLQVTCSVDHVLVIGDQLKLLNNQSAYFDVLTKSIGKTSIHIRATIENNINNKINNDDDEEDDDVGSYVVISNTLEVQVFTPLKLIPEEITVTPGTKFQITTSGGPQPDCLVTYHLDLDAYHLVSDRNKVKDVQRIATIDKDGMVFALKVGRVRITAECSKEGEGHGVGGGSGGGGPIYSKASMLLNVLEMTGVKIFLPVERVEVGKEVPVYAVGSHNKTIEPYSFSEETKFYWSVSNQDIAQLKSVFHETGFSMKNHGNFARRLLTLKPGHVTVTLRLHMEDGTQMVDSVTVQIIDKFRILSPDIQPAHILITPNTELKLVTNFKVSTFKGGPIHFQASEGVIKSTSAVGSFPVVFDVQGEDDVGSESAGSGVGDGEHVYPMQSFVAKVKPIAYIMVTPMTHLPINEDQLLSSLPIGLEFDLIISYHDNMGLKFDAVNVGWSFQMNKHSSVKLLEGQHQQQNSTLRLKAINSGYTVLKAFVPSHPSLVDYIGFHVSPSIHPSDVHIVVGSVICFNSIIHPKNGQLASWSNADELLSIDELSGVAVAHQIGISEITFSFESFVTSTKVRITPVLRYLVKVDDSAGDDLISDAMETKLVRVVLVGDGESSAAVLGSDDSCMERVRTEKLNITHSYSFSCSAEFSTVYPGDVKLGDIFHVEPYFYYQTGHYYCRFKLRSPSTIHNITNMITISTIHLTISSPIKSPSSSLPPEMVSLRFVPGFKVLDPGSYRVSPGLVETFVRVVAVEEVVDCIKTKSENEMVLKIDKRPSSIAEDGVVYFRLTLQRSGSLDFIGPIKRVKVMLSCDVIGQEEVVEVMVDEEGEGDIIASSSSLTWYYIKLFVRTNYNIIFYGLLLFFTLITVYLALPSIKPYGSSFVTSKANVFHSDLSPFKPHMTPNIYNTPSYSGGSPRGQRLWTLNSSVNNK